MKRTVLLLTSLPVLLIGCASTPPHTCQMGVYNPDCHTMDQVYETARHSPAKATTVAQIMSPDPAHPVKPAKPPAPVGNHGGAYAEPGEVGQPVFQQPRVMRVWIAPYVDADGNLRSGEYTYFNTPGAWNYGSTRTPGTGSASTLFAPLKPGTAGTLGFTPKVASPSQPAPPKPGDHPNAGSLNPAQVPSITPPAQKLGE